MSTYEAVTGDCLSPALQESAAQARRSFGSTLEVVTA